MMGRRGDFGPGAAAFGSFCLCLMYPLVGVPLIIVYFLCRIFERKQPPRHDFMAGGRVVRPPAAVDDYWKGFDQ